MHDISYDISKAISKQGFSCEHAWSRGQICRPRKQKTFRFWLRGPGMPGIPASIALRTYLDSDRWLQVRGRWRRHLNESGREAQRSCPIAAHAGSPSGLEAEKW